MSSTTKPIDPTQKEDTLEPVATIDAAATCAPVSSNDTGAAPEPAATDDSEATSEPFNAVGPDVVPQPDFMPRTFPTEEEWSSVQRSDIILIRPRNTEPELYLVHRNVADTTNSSLKLYGVCINDHVYVRHTHPETELSRRFKEDSDPHMAVSLLRKEILDPLVRYLDTIADYVPQLFFDDSALSAWVRPAEGAIRTVILGKCPFECVDGVQMQDRPYPELFAEFLATVSIGARLIAQQLHDIKHPLLCPGCHGHRLMKEDLERIYTQCRMTKPPAEGEDVNINMLPVQEVSDDEGQAAVAAAEKTFEVQDPEMFARTVSWHEEITNARYQLGYSMALMCASVTNGAVFENAVPLGQGMNEDPDLQERGLSKAQISRLPTANLEFWQSVPERALQDNCAICRFDPYVAGDMIIGLSCKHFFHQKCLVPWLEENEDCPTCRTKLVKREQVVNEDEVEIDWEDVD